MAKIRALKVWFILFFISTVGCDFSRVTTYDLMKCSYGDRGSLTATCVNATPNFFKSTLYKFDHLDETLRCVNCTLTTIESNTFDLPGNQIKILDLENSLIETLQPKAFMGLIFLTDLNLANNKIRSIFPGTFNGTKKITTINLINNEITILSEDGFSELINLKKLILQKNKIKVMDARAFRGLASLEYLDLSLNGIETIGTSLENVTSLQFVNLSRNAIKHLSGMEFFRLENLNEIDLSHNLFIDDFTINLTPKNQLRSIILARNKINFLWFPSMNLNSLEVLDLKYNNISSIHTDRFETLPNLHTLDLAYNKLEIIKTGQFSGLPQLRTLNFSHNVIKEVLVTGIFSFMNLHILDLSHNQISDLDYTALISRTPGLAYLRLEDNMLPCDLETEMQTQFVEDNFKFVLYDNVVGSPKCVDRPLTKKTFISSHDTYVEEAQQRVSATDIWILVLLSLVIAAIGVLFYLQYLFYKGVPLTNLRRVSSTVQLISENEPKEDELVHA